MARKVLPVVSVLALSAFAIFFLTGAGTGDKEILHESFFIDAVYHSENQYVEIVFRDETKKTSSVVLEILGMADTFHKTYDNYEFVERIPFSEPRHGWSIHPIVLEINHPEFGKIGLKTEIHPSGEEAPPVIFST